MRSISIVSAVAAIGLLTSGAYAEGVDQNTKQQIEQITSAYQEAWNKHDAAGIAALYAPDGVLVTQAPKVVKVGRQDIEQNYTNAFKVLPENRSNPVIQISLLGPDAAFAVGEFHLSAEGDKRSDGHWTAAYTREGGKWRIRLLTAVPDQPPTCKESFNAVGCR